MSDYRKRLVEVVHGKPLSRIYRLSDATLIADLGQLLSEADSLRADITGLEDGNMTWMCDQLDKAKAENAAQAVELERMREALRQIADGSAPPIPHGHYLAHRRAVDVARVALSVKAG